MDSWILLCSTAYSPSRSFFILVLRLSWMAIGRWLLSPLDMPPFVLNMVAQAHLVFFLHQPGNQSFLQVALLPFIGEWYLEAKIWALGVPMATIFFETLS